ncbi:unnamed protein product [Somion occarium]|uniref:C2H2-type domain-containing protein n=1 Tax=Somion occarium TaxID=3059160 RepID=A0ABP1E6B0_9APHY
MSANVPPIHLAECEECVQSCDDPGCTIELTPQCTEQCVVVCNDPHHSLGSCVDDSSRSFPCSDGLGCSDIDDFLQCCTDYHPHLPDGKPFVADPHRGSFGWDSSFDSMFSAVDARHAGDHTNPYAHSNTLPNISSHNSLMHNHHLPYDCFAPTAAPSAVSPTYHPSSSSLADALNPPPAANDSGTLRCMWGNCLATFNSMAELVGHVNLQHLRLPGSGSTTPQSHLAQNASLPSTKADNLQQADQFSCLWADCHQYPDVSTIPGSSTGNPVDTALDVLANHLLHDHLGLTNPPPPQLHPAGSLKTTHSPTVFSLETTTLISPAESSTPSSLSPSGPPTPAPEHDCSLPSHVCRWIGCGQMFVSCDELTVHINAAHVGGGKAHYDCYWEGCNRNGESGFASKQKICRHLQSHTGHRPFQCKICKQHFSEAATLAQHMRRHTQERPYVCDYPGCGKSFAITGALTIHKRTHNGHKPFKCTYCDRAFAESSNLSKHLRTHTGARPYSCAHTGCTKTFARPDQLARHMSVHRKKTSPPEDNGQAP